MNAINASSAARISAAARALRPSSTPKSSVRTNFKCETWHLVSSSLDLLRVSGFEVWTVRPTRGKGNPQWRGTGTHTGYAMINDIGKSSDQAGLSLRFSMISGIQDDHWHYLVNSSCSNVSSSADVPRKAYRYDPFNRGAGRSHRPPKSSDDRVIKDDIRIRLAEAPHCDAGHAVRPVSGQPFPRLGEQRYRAAPSYARHHPT
jgi:hypothetical protein